MNESLARRCSKHVLHILRRLCWRDSRRNRVVSQNHRITVRKSAQSHSVLIDLIPWRLPCWCGRAVWMSFWDFICFFLTCSLLNVSFRKAIPELSKIQSPDIGVEGAEVVAGKNLVVMPAGQKGLGLYTPNACSKGPAVTTEARADFLYRFWCQDRCCSSSSASTAWRTMRVLGLFLCRLRLLFVWTQADFLGRPYPINKPVVICLILYASFSVSHASFVHIFFRGHTMAEL